MKNLILACVFSAVSLFGQSVTTCPDGSVRKITPFNVNNPCSLSVEIPEESVSDDFLRLWGPPPTFKGDNLKWRAARVDYQTALKNFRGILKLSDKYELVSEYYAAYGLGEPVTYATPYGVFIRFPDAPYVPTQGFEFTVLNSPMVVISSWQVKAIEAGFCISNVHFAVPPAYQKLNTEQCNPEDTANLSDIEVLYDTDTNIITLPATTYAIN